MLKLLEYITGLVSTVILPLTDSVFEDGLNVNPVSTFAEERFPVVLLANTR